jgi:hypothetical protein
MMSKPALLLGYKTFFLHIIRVVGRVIYYPVNLFPIETSHRILDSGKNKR